MIVMYLAWMIIKRPDPNALASSNSTATPTRRKWWTSDLVDINTVDLLREEYEEQAVDEEDDQKMEKRLKGRSRWAWRVYYWVV